MVTEGGLSAVELFTALVAVAAIGGLLVVRRSMPYSVALLLAGIGIGLVLPPETIPVTSDLILAVLIPGLVFEAAYKLDTVELWQTNHIVAVLAVPGVLITAAVVALVAWATTGLDPALGFLLGAIISATDPVAVIDLFKRLHVPTRLATVVDAEALFNDGTGVVLFAVALTALTQPVGLVGGTVQFAWVVLLGAVVGVVGGLIAVRVMAAVADRRFQSMVSILAAYGTYLVALRLGGSGIIATVLAGVVLGWAGHRGILGRPTMAALDDIWGVAAFIMTALTFLLVGLVVDPELVLGAVPLIVAGYIAITLARAFVVYVLIGGAERALPGPSMIPVAHLHVMFWAGLRGTIAAALALALPASVPGRDLLVGAVFGIVVVTILVQGTTAGFVIRWSGIPIGPEHSEPT